jgi:deoxynucleotide monophosphate kinase-like protein
VLRELGYKQWSLAWHFKIGLIGKGLATYDEVFFTKPANVRTLLQREGTEEGRDKYGEDVWVNTMQQWFRLLNEKWGIEKFCIPDVRFPNEANAIKAMGGKVLRIDSPIRARSSALSKQQREHKSEIALDSYDAFDAIIQNDPRHSETTKRQVLDALGEEPEHHSIVWDAWDTVVDKIDGIYSKIIKSGSDD